MKLGILYFPKEYPDFLKKGVFRVVVEKMCGLSYERRNPRSESYMRELASTELGQDAIVSHWPDVTKQDYSCAEEIIMLWPDGNGYGWFSVERQLISVAQQRGIPLRVLNGRRRSFLVGGLASLVPFWVRRNMERFWIGEVAFLALFIVATPIMLFWDLSRGRR